jgi:hypothetical protein
MVFLDVGVGDGTAVGVGVDQQGLPAGGGRLEGEVDGDGHYPRSLLKRRGLADPVGGVDSVVRARGL